MHFGGCTKNRLEGVFFRISQNKNFSYFCMVNTRQIPLTNLKKLKIVEMASVPSHVKTSTFLILDSLYWMTLKVHGHASSRKVTQNGV